jgi:hypothetical protein
VKNTDIYQNGFLQGFNEVKSAGESASRMVRRLFPNDLANKNVGGLACPFPQFGSASASTIGSNDFSFSKSLDTRSYDPAFTVVNGGANRSAPAPPFDINNRTTFSYDLLFGRPRRFGGNVGRMAHHVVGGRRMAGIFTLTSGQPFAVYSGQNTASNIVNSLADCQGCTRKDGAALTDSKHMKMAKRYNIEIRAGMINLTTVPTFGFPTTYASAAFGRIRDTVLSSSRKIQMGARFYF